MTIPFIIGEQHAAQLHALKDLAERQDRRITYETLMVYTKGFDPDDPNTRGFKGSPIPLDQTIVLKPGWKITYSIEDQKHGPTRYLSISCLFYSHVPTPEIVEHVKTYLGFKFPLRQCYVYLETYAVNQKAVNVIEFFDDHLM